MFKNRIILFALLLFFLGTLFLVIRFFFIPSYEQVRSGSQNENTNTASSGALPSTGGGFNANVAAGIGGSLPNINIVGRTVGNPPPDIVALGGKTMALQVGEDEALDFRVVGNREVSYYNPDTQKFYRLTSKGERVELSSEAYPDVERVTWSARGEKAIITFPDGTDVLTDFSQNTRLTLPRDGRDFVFQGNSNQLVFKYETQDSDQNFVMTGDPSGADVKAVEPLGDKGDLVQTTYSPDGSVVAFYRNQTGASKEEIIFIGQRGENFKSMNVSGFGFRGAWTPDGSRLLYSVVSSDNDYNPSLWIVDARGESIGLNNTPLYLPTTVDSCVLDEEGARAYCAVPKETPAGAGIYPELYQDRETFLYELNLDSGSRKLLADPVTEDGQTGFIASQLQVSPDGRTLYFLDQKTDRVFSLQLK